jgi:hypothetical protein
VGEGQSEETFAADVLRPALIGNDVLVLPRLIPTSKHGRGGALKRERVLRYLRNTLREQADTYVTTFFDLYALGGDFPGVEAAGALLDPVHRASTIQQHFASAVVAAADCRPDRFIAHVQPYEFESLLFSDVARFVDLESAWTGQIDALSAARSAFSTPEHINDGAATHPSARLASALRSPGYRKVLHGSRLAEHIGLSRMRSECRHFDSWLSRIEALAPPAGVD